MSNKQPKRKQRSGVDEYGRTPLHYAASDGNVEDVAIQLKAGADPNLQDDNGWSPLHFAAQASSPKVTERLIYAGASVHLKDSYGNTPLFRAVFASKGDGNVINLLRAAGADPNDKNNSGVSPVELARRIANYDISLYFSDVP